MNDVTTLAAQLAEGQAHLAGLQNQRASALDAAAVSNPAFGATRRLKWQREEALTAGYLAGQADATQIDADIAVAEKAEAAARDRAQGAAGAARALAESVEAAEQRVQDLRRQALEAARSDALDRYEAAHRDLKAAVQALNEPLAAMMASASIADALTLRLTGGNTIELGIADALVGEMRIPIYTAGLAHQIGSPRDAVLEPARNASRTRLDELRALNLLT